MRVVTSKYRAIKKNLETLSVFNILVQFEARTTKRTAILIKQDQTQLFSTTHCLQNSLRKRYAWRPRISFINGKAWFQDRVLFLKLIRKVVHKIYLYTKQDHLENRNKMKRATEKPEATLLTTENLEKRSQRWNCRMHGDKITSQSWLRCSRNISIRTSIPERHESKAGVQQVQRGITTITRRHEPHRDLRILQNINVLIAMPFPKSGLFIAVAGDIWGTRGRPIAILLQSLALSLRKIPVEDQNMVSLKDKWCSARRNRFLRKQDKANMAAIRRYFQGGTKKKDTERHWRSTILAKKKSCFSIASLLKDTTFQLHDLNGCRTPNIGFFVWMLMVLKSLFDRVQNLSLH